MLHIFRKPQLYIYIYIIYFLKMTYVFLRIFANALYHCTSWYTKVQYNIVSIFLSSRSQDRCTQNTYTVPTSHRRVIYTITMLVPTISNNISIFCGYNYLLLPIIFAIIPPEKCDDIITYELKRNNIPIKILKLKQSL